MSNINSRHDLRPGTANSNAATDELPPPLEGDNTTEHSGEAEGSTEGSTRQQRRRISRFLDLNRLRHAPPDERIAALRELREQSRAEGDQVEDVEEQRSRRTRLTGRLRDTFRIRTRTQNVASTQ
jgi:hypothetical protein